MPEYENNIKKTIMTLMLMASFFIFTGCGLDKEVIVDDDQYYDEMFDEEEVSKKTFEACEYVIPEGYKEDVSQDPLPEEEENQAEAFSTVWIHQDDEGLTLTAQKKTEDLTEDINSMKAEAAKVKEEKSSSGVPFTLIWQDWPFEQASAIYENDGIVYIITTDEPESEILEDDDLQIFLRFVKSIEFKE